MQIDLKAIGDRVVVDSRGQAAGLDQRLTVKPESVGKSEELIRGLPLVAAAAAAYIDAKFTGPGVQAALERAHHGGRNPGRVPVHAEHRSKRLESKRIAQSGQQLGPAVVLDHGRRDRCPQRRHARRQPGGDATAVER
jgi:hypothetical protein